jgi:adenosine deaminase
VAVRLQGHLDACSFLAEKNNVKLAYDTVEEVQEANNFTNLDNFLKLYYQGMEVLVHESDFFDLGCLGVFDSCESGERQTCGGVF